MFQLTQLPKRPYKNFNDYLEFNYKMCVYLNPDITRKYGCSYCSGKGTVVAPGEFCDPNEGYKNADRINCSYCKGVRTLPDKQHRLIYKKKIDQWQIRYNTANNLLKTQKIALSKIKEILSDEEMEILQLK